MRISHQTTDEPDFGPPQMPDMVADVDEAAAVDVDRESDEWTDPFLDDASGIVSDDACNACYYPAPTRWWFDADYLMLWTNGDPIPPLVTTTRPVPPRNQAGVLDWDNTQILLGGELDEGMRSGLRLTGGLWLDSCQTWGLQATWFSAGDASDDESWQSLGAPVLARPFFNVGSGREDSQLVAYPDVVEGVARVTTDSDLDSVEALLRWNWRCGSRGRIDLLGGYRYLRFQEGLVIEENLISRDPRGVIEIGTKIDLYDSFDVRNSFHGGEIGVLTSLERRFLSLDVGAKLGLGNVQRELTIDGATIVETPDGGQSDGPGGLLALPSNMGRYTDNQFALLPELDLKVRLLLTEHVSASIGYNLLFLTQVYRAGEQIDRSIDASQLPGFLPINDRVSSQQPHPVALQSSSTLQAQTLSLGLTVTY